MSDIEVIVPEWKAPSSVHATFALRAAVSIEEPGRLRQALSLPDEPAWLHQVHGIEVVDLDADTSSASGELSKPRADASVTRTPNRVCVVRVADCMPVLFASRDGRVVGAAHAGWRGMSAGVIEATAHAMAVEPSQLHAWMGPCIGPAHFEVGDEVREAFISHSNQAEAAFTRNQRGRWQCNLYTLARQRLEALGVREITGDGWCTYSDPTRFFSFRRDGSLGRMAALIWLT